MLADAPPPPPAAIVAAAPRPSIRQHRIPFGEQRRDDMRAYARRHYGLNRMRLLDPQAIVIHYTATNSYTATWNTFASNAPDPELKERPGTCAHFVIDRSGRINQLVSLRWMCRHTVGLNWTSFGIEHVATSEQAVFANKRMLRASLRLTRWLQGRYSISLENVIGHNENRESPLHRERVARLRTQTHGDFPTRWMKRYRSAIRRSSDAD